MVILIKSSKTLQDRRSVATVTIPALGSSLLCPVKVLTVTCQAFPTTNNQPWFLYVRQGLLCPLTESIARKGLKYFKIVAFS